MPTNFPASRKCWLFCCATLAAAVTSPPLGFCQEYVEIAERTAADSSSSKKITVHLWVVEVDRDKLRNLGFSWDEIKLHGETTKTPISTVADLANMAERNTTLLQRFLKSLEQNNLVRTLSEPTITSLSGRQASLAVGPMHLDVTPTTIDGQQVQLQYRVEVSREAASAGSVPFIAGSTVQIEAGKPCLVSQSRSSWQTTSGKSRQTEVLIMIQADTPNTLTK